MKEVKLMMVNEKNLENVSKENKKKSNNSKKTCVIRELTLKTPKLVGPVCQN